MPERVIFDQNEFTSALLNAGLRGWADTFKRWFEGENQQKYNETTSDLQARIQDVTQRGNVNDGILAKYEYQLKTNPNGEFADEFSKYWNFAKYIFMPYNAGYTSSYQLILNKIGIFSEDVQLAILKNMLNKLRNQDQPALWENINTKIANNKKASTEDKVDAAHNLLHKNHDVVRDVIELLKQDLDKELKSDFPNSETINNICTKAENIMLALQNSFINNDPYVHKIQNALSKDYIKTVRKEFDINKVLAGNTEYVPQINKSLEERAVNAEKQAHEATKQAQKYEETNIRLNRLQMEYNDIVRQLESEKSKNEHLTGELNLLNKQVEKQNSFIKSVRMKIGQLKTGLLAGNGVKDLQQFINNDHTL